MADRLSGPPEEYLTAKRAAMFRRDCDRAGVPPVLFISSGRYSGDECGMAIPPDIVAAWLCEGLRALNRIRAVT